MVTMLRKTVYPLTGFTGKPLPQYAYVFMTVLLAAVTCFATNKTVAAEDPFRLFEAGQENLQAGRYDEAVRDFSGALSLFPPDDRNAQIVRLARAEAHFRKGNLDLALKDVSTVLGLAGLDGKSRASALQLRGIINSGRNRDELALQDFTDAIKTRHGDMELRASSFANRGITLVTLGRFDEAVSDFNKAIELNPNYAFAYAGRGNAYLRKDNLEAARRDTQKALSLNPDSETTKIAERVLKSISFNFTGPDRVSVPLSDEGHIFVQVRFGKHGQPHRFMVDTGASFTLISRELLEAISRETQVRQLGTARVMTADGAMHEVLRYSVKDVYLFNFPIGEMQVLVFAARRKAGPNLFGAGSLKQISISIDGAAGKAEIRRIEGNQSKQR
ncbi:MAG: tetratricopeptide repeat protein [Desulfomonile sp.]|nr:tetratricopeptide repeat protein [Desulfomonile sp.]